MLVMAHTGGLMGVVRIFLALVVVTFHVSAQMLVRNHLVPVSPDFTLGFHSAYAVLFFYVISGFLITFTLSRNYWYNSDGVFNFYRIGGYAYSLFIGLFLLSR